MEQTGAAEAEHLRSMANAASSVVKSNDEKVDDNNEDEPTSTNTENEPLLTSK